mmetsp:Transcript_8504/g.26312  ORF Transcript_8504/g.26312 Transcript_8504/m.26312 type:complete len:225 (-) Transcript_8504:718-1392(-)
MYTFVGPVLVPSWCRRCSSALVQCLVLHPSKRAACALLADRGPKESHRRHRGSHGLHARLFRSRRRRTLHDRVVAAAVGRHLGRRHLPGRNRRGHRAQRRLGLRALALAAALVEELQLEVVYELGHLLARDAGVAKDGVPPRPLRAHSVLDVRERLDLACRHHLLLCLRQRDERKLLWLVLQANDAVKGVVDSQAGVLHDHVPDGLQVGAVRVLACLEHHVRDA